MFLRNDKPLTSRELLIGKILENNKSRAFSRISFDRLRRFTWWSKQDWRVLIVTDDSTVGKRCLAFLDSSWRSLNVLPLVLTKVVPHFSFSVLKTLPSTIAPHSWHTCSPSCSASTASSWQTGHSEGMADWKDVNVCKTTGLLWYSRRFLR